MTDTMIQVKIGDTIKQYPKGISYSAIVSEYKEIDGAPIVLVYVDGKLRELHHHVKKDCEIKFETTKGTIGRKTYRRSACLVLLKAIYDIVGKKNVQRVVLRHTMGTGYYFKIADMNGVSQNFLDAVTVRMQELVAQKLPIMKRSVGTDEAIELFHKHGMYDKEYLFRYRRVSRVNIYSIENYEDYYYGFMVEDTSYIKYFKLFPYDEGFVMQLPTLENPGVVPPFVDTPKIFKIQKFSKEWGERFHVSTVGELNDRISQEGLQEIVLVQEAFQETQVSKIAEQIMEQGNRKFIMIAGPSSSGKTTFSHRLSTQLSAHGLHPHPIALDNYFVNRDQTPLDEFGERNYETLKAIDIKQFNEDMMRLIQGETVELPEYNFKSGKREYKGRSLTLKENDILVLEGIHGLNDELSHSLPKDSKFKIYVSALTQLNIDEHNRIPTTDGRLIRRIVRDARGRGTTAKETIAMWKSVRRGEAENIFPFQEEADVMFNSALVYELACLKVYAEPLLFAINKGEPEYYEANRLLKFLDYFIPIPSDIIPNNSILREFIGGGCFGV
ncbi:MAG: nucleoside kinase [Lachnospiraceae bacterium]